MTTFGRLLPRAEIEGVGPHNYLELTPIDPGAVDVPEGALYVDSTDDNRLKFKKATGVEFNLAAQCAPASYTSTHTAVDDGDTSEQTCEAPVSGTPTEEGLIVQVRLVDVDGVGGGDVRVQIFNDYERTVKVFDMLFDLADELYDYVPAYFCSDNYDGHTGAMYVSLTNNTGADAKDFRVEVRTISALPDATAPEGDGTGVGEAVVGDGLVYTGGRVLVRPATNSGLELAGASPTKTIGVKAGTGITVSGDTTSVDTAAVAMLTGDQDIAGKKRFTGSLWGRTPAGDPGAPTGGAHKAGDEFIDSVFNRWLCIADGTPGTWLFSGFAFAQGVDYSVAAKQNNGNYTAAVNAAASVDVEVAVTGRRGVIHRLLIWAATSAYAQANVDQSFRVKLYPNENYYGRDELWAGLGQARITYLTAGITGGAGNEATVSDIDVAAPDDLVRLRAAAGPYGEFARVTARTPASSLYSLDEAVANDFATNDLVMVVTEFQNIFFHNNSGDADHKNLLFFRLFNDGATTAIRFGYQLDIESFGGGGAY